MPKLVSLLIDYRHALLVVAIALGALALRSSTQVEFDRSIENMFAPDDPILAPYHHLKQTFGGNEIVLAVYRDEDLLAADGRGLARLAAISKQLQAAPGVRDVLSLAEVNTTLELLQKANSFLPLGN